MYKEDLPLNDQGLMCQNIKPNQIIYLIYIYKEDLALIYQNTKPNETKLF